MAASTNRLLEALSPNLRSQILSLTKTIDLPRRTTLYEPEKWPPFLYFLTSGIASVAVTVPSGGSAEIAILGCEGMIGGIGLLGSTPPVARCFMQTNGTALRVPRADMRRLFDASAELRERVLQSIQQQAITVDQIAACNKLHQAEERLARWLLTAGDRLGEDVMQLTQESLSQMLGTRRTTVALVAGTLQKAGLISYRRGAIRIVDRARMEETACDCYRITRRLQENLYEETVTSQ